MVGKVVLGWLVGAACGMAVIALPDSDDRVFSLSRTPGPSPLDLVGAVVLVASWVPVAAVLWHHRGGCGARGARRDCSRSREPRFSW